MKKNNKKNKDWAPCSFTAQGINKCKKLLLEESFKKKVSLLQVERMPVACIIWDYDFRVMTWNPAAEKIFGYKAKDIIGKKAFDLILEKKEKDKIKKIQATILQGKRIVKDIRNNKTKKGKKIICEWFDSPLKDSDHQIVGILSMVQDVTESKNLEEKYKIINQELSKQVKNLKESKKNTNQILEGLSLSVEKLKKTERNLSDVIDFLPDATFVLDKEKKVIIWNKAIERMTGINAEDMIGKGNHEYSIPFYGKRRSVLMDLIWKKDQKIIKKYSKIIREDACLSAEVFCSALYGGRGAYVYAKVSPLHDEKGRIIGAIELVRDITERKLAEDIVKAQALKISKAIAKDEAILQSIGDGLIVVGADGKILKTNLAFEKLTGWRGEEVIGHNFIKAVPRENEKGELLSFENEIIRLILKGNPIEDNLNQESAPFVWNYIRKDKTKFPGSSIINPIYLSDQTTELSYWLESKTDSTTATIWVKIPSLASGDNTIYMYYANASATTASNGDNTFEFFDDFNDGTINNSKWTTSGPNNSESGGELRQVNTGGDTMSSIQSQSLYGENYSIIGRVKLGSASYTQYLFGFSDPESTGNDIALWNSWQNTSYSLFAYNGNAHAGTAGGASYVTLSSNYRNIYIRAEVIRAGSGNSILSVNGSTLTTRSGSYTGNAAAYFYGSYAVNDNSYLDWVFVRKYASEPTSSFGAEQNN